MLPSPHPSFCPQVHTSLDLMRDELAKVHIGLQSKTVRGKATFVAKALRPLQELMDYRAASGDLKELARFGLTGDNTSLESAQQALFSLASKDLVGHLGHMRIGNKPARAVRDGKYAITAVSRCLPPGGPSRKQLEEACG